MSVEIRVRIDPRAMRELGRLHGIDPITRRAIRHAWFALGKKLRDSANREILRKPKGGRVYLVRLPSGRRRKHRASAPGETHANMSGDLRKSIGWKVASEHEMQFGYGVSAREGRGEPRYARFVEFGTSRMKERPSLRNAIRANDGDVEREFGEEMDRAFREFSP